jgi:hypothetical protein
MLYTNGPAWLNGSSVPKTSAIFSGDLVQTRSDSVANIKAPGTSVVVLSGSLVQLQGSAVKLEHGSVNVLTSNNMKAQVGGLKIVPAAGGGILDSTPVIYTGLAAIGVLTGWALVQGDDPRSDK